MCEVSVQTRGRHDECALKTILTFVNIEAVAALPPLRPPPPAYSCERRNCEAREKDKVAAAQKREVRS